MVSRSITLKSSETGCTIEPDFPEVVELVAPLNGNKQQILNALSGFNREYVWAVTYQDPPVPALTRRQFRLALVLNGYNLADIELLINQISDEMQRQIIQVEWQDATTFERHSTNLLVMADLMGMDKPTVDVLWTQALAL